MRRKLSNHRSAGTRSRVGGWRPNLIIVRVFLSAEVGMKTCYKEFGGLGYSHVPRQHHPVVYVAMRFGRGCGFDHGG
jgi:hypothetical protein